MKLLTSIRKVRPYETCEFISGSQWQRFKHFAGGSSLTCAMPSFPNRVAKSVELRRDRSSNNISRHHSSSASARRGQLKTEVRLQDDNGHHCSIASYTRCHRTQSAMHRRDCELDGLRNNNGHSTSRRASCFLLCVHVSALLLGSPMLENVSA